MLDPGKPSFTPKKGKPSIVMFVGLQGIFIFFIKISFSFYGNLLITLNTGLSGLVNA